MCDCGLDAVRRAECEALRLAAQRTLDAATTPAVRSVTRIEWSESGTAEYRWAAGLLGVIDRVWSDQSAGPSPIGREFPGHATYRSALADGRDEASALRETGTYQSVLLLNTPPRPPDRDGTGNNERVHQPWSVQVQVTTRSTPAVIPAGAQAAYDAVIELLNEVYCTPREICSAEFIATCSSNDTAVLEYLTRPGADGQCECYSRPRDTPLCTEQERRACSQRSTATQFYALSPQCRCRVVSHPCASRRQPDGRRYDPCRPRREPTETGRYTTRPDGTRGVPILETDDEYETAVQDPITCVCNRTQIRCRQHERAPCFARRNETQNKTPNTPLSLIHI